MLPLTEVFSTQKTVTEMALVVMILMQIWSQCDWHINSL